MPSETVSIVLNSPHEVCKGVAQVTLRGRVLVTVHWPQQMPRLGRDTAWKGGSIGTTGPQHGPSSRPSGTQKPCAEAAGDAPKSAPARTAAATRRGPNEVDMELPPE